MILENHKDTDRMDAARMTVEQKIACLEIADKAELEMFIDVLAEENQIFEPLHIKNRKENIN